MPISPRGDPTRPLALAARYARALGVLLVGVAAVVAGSLLYYGLDPRRSRQEALLLAAAGVYAVLGAAFWVFAGLLWRRRRAWAAIALMSVGGFVALVSGFSLARAAQVATVPAARPAFARPEVLLSLGMVAAVFVFAVLTVAYAARSMRPIRELAGEGRRGFRPTVPGGDGGAAERFTEVPLPLRPR